MHTTIFLLPFSLFYHDIKLELKLKEGLFGFKGENGKWVIKPKYERALDFSKGLALVKENGQWGCINHHNKTIIPLYLDLGEMLIDSILVIKNIENQVFFELAIGK